LLTSAARRENLLAGAKKPRNRATRAEICWSPHMPVTFLSGTYWTVRLQNGAIARLCERVPGTPYRVTHQGWIDSSDRPNRQPPEEGGVYELLVVNQGWIVTHPDGAATQHRPPEVAGAYYGPLAALRQRNAISDEIVRLGIYRPATFTGALPGITVASLPPGAKFEEVL
jgi:hypothetical protein